MGTAYRASRGRVAGVRPAADLNSATRKIVTVKILNSIMAVIGWTVTIAALLAALGFGYVRMHFGPIDIRVPIHSR